MAEQIRPKAPQPSDEIDLGQLLQMIGNGTKKLGNGFLRIFIYLKSNALILVGLVILGVATNFVLNMFVSKRLKTDVIVRPNFESENYLYDVVDEIAVNIAAKNVAFFDSIDISVADLKGFDIRVEAIEGEEKKNKDALIEEIKYLEVLQNFKDEGFVIDILKSELFRKSIVEHKITFIYKDPKTGPAIVEKLLNYINANPYFDEVKKVHEENTKSRIEKNTVLIDQINKLVANYTTAILAEKGRSDGRIVYLDKENTLNVTDLLSLKNKLIKEIEDKKLEIAEQTNVLSIINLGRAQELKKALFNKRIVAIPTYLVLAFFLFSFVRYLNAAAKKIE